MWISANDTGMSKQPAVTITKTPNKNVQRPYFSDEMNQHDGGSQPSTSSENQPQSAKSYTADRATPQSSTKKAIKTYTEPVRPKGNDRTSQRTRSKKHSTGHISWGLGAMLYASGCLASGILFSALSEQEKEVLSYVLKQLSISASQPFERFLTLFLPALLQVILVSIFSFCAIGAPLIGIFITLSGIACGATALTWISEYGLVGILFYVISIGLYQALLTAIVCRLGQNGIQISSRLFSAAFRQTASSQDSEHQPHLCEGFLRSNLGAIIGLIAICGFLAATSDLSQTIMTSIR